MASYETLSPRLALQLAAPHTWAASAYPALFGILYSLLIGLHLHPLMALTLLFISVLMQSGVNALNDYFDYVKGADTEEDCLEQSDATLVYHRLDPLHVLLLGLGFLGTAAVLGIGVVLAAGPAPLVVGVLGGAVVLGYSGGPVPLSYLPVGELVSGFVMGGLIPLGVVAAASGTLLWQAIPMAVPFIIGIALIMMTNNVCDIEKDLKAGRKTLPVILGREVSRVLFRTLVVIWLATLCLLAWVLAGPKGLICPIFLLIFGRSSFGFLLCAPLGQSMRIQQMKGILEANVLGNGAYLAAILIALL